MNIDKRKMLEHVCENQPCTHGEGYCILKEMILHDAKYSNRMLAQMYCVNRFKYERSQQEHQDVGWSAWKEWSERGYATKFAETFVEDMPPDKLYAAIMASPRSI